MKGSYTVSLTSMANTQESFRRLHKLAKNSSSVSELIEQGFSDKLVLLSSVVGANREKFSTREVFELPTKKKLDKQTRIKDMYKCFKTYASAFDVVLSYDESNPNGLYTRVSLLEKKNLANFLVKDFPLGKLMPIKGVTMGRIEDMVQDLEDYEDYGVDYLFSRETGEYLTPVHVEMTFLEQRLRENSNVFDNLDEVEEEDVPDPTSLGFLSIGSQEKKSKITFS